MSQAFVQGGPVIPAPPAVPAAPPQRIDRMALVAVSAVLFGTFTSLLNFKLTDIGIADLGGALGVSSEQASWINTAYAVAEAAAVPAVVWLRMTISPAPVLLVSAAMFTILSLLAPFSPSLSVLLTDQALRGLTAGALIPMTYGVIMRNLPQNRRIYALSFYALISAFTPSLSVYVEAVVMEQLSWQYLFWLNVIPGALVVFATAAALKWDPVKFVRLRRPDLFGLLTLSLGIAALVAALYEGEELDWLHSGLINGLLLSSLLLLSAFVVHSILHPNPMVDLRILTQRNAILALSVTFIARFATMSTAMAIPEFLIWTHGYTALETGPLFVATSLPALVLAPCVAWLCYRIDPRNLVVFGAIVYGIGVMMCIHLTNAWTGNEFMIPMLVQSVGSAFLAVPVMVVVSEDITFPQIAWISTWVHIVRTTGTAMATAAIGALLRVREQVQSDLLGQHVQAGAANVQGRLDGTAGALSSGLQTTDASRQAVELLAQTVQREAYVLASSDTLFVIALIVLAAAISGLLMKKTPLPGRFF
ncbi:MAG TPA: MFS transporter [Devosiaceae bacterium]|nr:MFS transporter [Devosiaceae bacterium]